MKIAISNHLVYEIISKNQSPKASPAGFDFTPRVEFTLRRPKEKSYGGRMEWWNSGILGFKAGPPRAAD